MSKFKTYCRIIDYLDVKHPDLAQLVRGTCVDLTLGSTRGKDGLTFLVPDAAYRAKIEKLAYSSKPDEASKACDMLNALILRDVFKSGSQFKQKQENIPNSLYPSQRVGLKGVYNNVVTFESGAVATLDTEFLDSSKKQNLAVWNLTGEIPVTTDKPALIKRDNAGRGTAAKGGKRGGYDQEVAKKLSENLRWKIAVAVENEYALSRLGAGGGNRFNSDPFVHYAMSLMHFLHEKYPEVVAPALELISFGKSDFYLLVEPHCEGGNYLINHELINEWWSARGEFSAAKGYELTNAAVAKLDNGKKLADIKPIRDEMLRKCNNRKCVDDIEGLYNTKYGPNASLKLLQDELRFLIHCSFLTLESRPYDSGQLESTVNMIGEYMYKMSGTAEERKSGMKVCNANVLKYAIAPGEKFAAIEAFVKSTCFMFMPLSEDEAKNAASKYYLEPSQDPKGLWNISLVNHKRLLELQGPKELEDALAKVDPKIAAEIRAALAK